MANENSIEPIGLESASAGRARAQSAKRAGAGQAKKSETRTEEMLMPSEPFHDPDELSLLKRVALPLLFQNREPNESLRVWVPGCGTGEEVYALAMSVVEFQTQRNDTTPSRFFGTDIDAGAIARARNGNYTENSLVDVTPGRRQRFFHRKDSDYYRVNKPLREMCIFARHDLINDPPYARLDLISCRNVLAFFAYEEQARLVELFRYALKPNGFLVLGASDAPAGVADFFEVVEPGHKIYRPTLTSLRAENEAASSAPFPTESGWKRQKQASRAGPNEMQREADRLVLAGYGPCGVVVDQDFEIIQFRGHTGQFLEPAPGTPSRNVLQMARIGLLGDLRECLEEARQGGLPVRREAIPINARGTPKTIHLQVMPITLASGQRFFVVLFEEAKSGSALEDMGHAPEPAAAVDAGERKSEIDHLRQELAATRSYLQSIIEQKEAANEEMKVANEEVLSANEELQSTNEELETAKEELQATNEELATVNDELQQRIEMAAQLSDDLTNLIDSVHLPTLVVSNEMILQRISPSAQRVLNLAPACVGWRLRNCKLSFDLQLEPLVQEVTDTLSAKQLEITNQSGRWFQLVIRPYTKASNKIEGAVLVFMDIDALKRRERQLKDAYEYAVHIVDTVRQPLVILNSDLRVRSANPAFYETFGLTPGHTENRPILALNNKQWNIGPLRTLLEEVLPRRSCVENYQMECMLPTVGRRLLVVNARKMTYSHGAAGEHYLLAIEDVTEQRRLEQEVLEIISREQRRIGQELHDTVGQELAGLGMMADALAQRHSSPVPGQETLPAKIRDGLERVHGQIRALSHGLIPVQVDAEGLRAALEDLTARTNEQSGLTCTFKCPELVLVRDNAAATHLFRIAHEAVSNALRHSHARHIDLALEAGTNRLELTIRDDGQGLSAGHEKTQGLGIRIMRFRAGLIGATVNVEPAPDGGTLVTCSIAIQVTSP